MNRTTSALLASLLLGSFTMGGLVAHAQVTNAQPPQIKTNAPTTRLPMRDMTDYWAQRLGLSDEQKQKVKPIFDAEREKYLEISKMTDLKAEERRAKMTAIREDTRTQLKPILTPEQWDKYARPFMTRTNMPVRLGTNALPGAPVPAAPSK
jgi:periplasmic protein CpxP/Spy